MGSYYRRDPSKLINNLRRRLPLVLMKGTKPLENINVMGEKISLPMTRRKALSTFAKVAIGAGVLVVVGGAAYWYQSATSSGKKPILAGCSLPLTGSYSAYGIYYQQGYSQWVNDVNAKGGLLGRPVQLIVLDDRSDVTTAINNVNRLITVEHVDVLLGGFPTPNVVPTFQIAEKAGMVMVQTGAGGIYETQKQAGYKWIFTIAPKEPEWTSTLLSWMNTVPSNIRPKTMVSILQTSNPFYVASEAPLVEAAKAMGITVTQQTFTNDNTDFAPLLQNMLSQPPDMVSVSANFVPGVNYSRLAAERKFRPNLVYVLAGPTAPNWAESLKTAAEYQFTSAQYFWSLPTPGNADFVAGYKAKYGLEPPREAGMAYVVGQVFAQAVEGAGTLEQTAVRTYLKSHTFPTVYGSISFDDIGYVVKQTMFLLQFQNSKLHVVGPPEFADTTAIYPAPHL